MIGNVNVPGALAADIANKVDKVNGKGLSTEDYTTAEKNKLAELKNYTAGTGITIDNDGTISCTTGASITVDNSFSTTSENPVQNKVITEAFLELTAVDLPVQSGTLTYDGSLQSPTWTGYDSTKMTLTGITSGTNAGTYIAKFTPKLPYRWSDSAGREERDVEWTIGRITSTLSFSSDSVETLSNLSTTVTLTTNSDGIISVESDDVDKVTASVSGTTVTVTGGSTLGSATVTVNIAQSTNYTAVSKTISVNNIAASSTLDDNSPLVIKMIAQSGQAPNLWSVGDKVGIALNGTVGILSLSDTYYAFIIGFNHNSSIEGTNSIHFMFGKTSGGQNIAFCDSKYGYDAIDCFKMTSTNLNNGGWRDSYMRRTICSSFKSVLPSSWLSIIAPCTKYSDNTGGGGETTPLDVSSYVTSTTDYIFILSEYEVQGKRFYANSTEKDYQAQYEYFANGNSKIFKKHNDISTACNWWYRSVNISGGFRYNEYSGGSYSGSGTPSKGFTPCFKVA